LVRFDGAIVRHINEHEPLMKHKRSPGSLKKEYVIQI
jgi:hypothetical protein